MKRCWSGGGNDRGEQMVGVGVAGENEKVLTEE